MLAIESQKPQHPTHTITTPGAIDVDAHILEPPNVWNEYLDPAHRDRGIRIVTGERGLEELEIDGKRATLVDRGTLSTLGAMGADDVIERMFDPTRTYLGEAPYGTMHPGERANLLKAENIDASVILPTVGLTWEAEIQDIALSQAYSTAYNRWVTDFASDEPNLLPLAHLVLSDPVAAAAELRRAVAAGARGGFVSQFTHNRRPLGHPDNDIVFATAVDLDVPLAIHPTFEPHQAKGDRVGTWNEVKKFPLYAAIHGTDGVRQQFTTMFDFGVFEKFPKLRFLVLECGGGWLAYWLDRMDGFYGTTFGKRLPLKRKPSEYFSDNVWVSCDPDEHSVPYLASRYGIDRFLWGSDFPHADHSPDYVLDLNELIGNLAPEDRPKFAGDNARALFKL